MDRKCPRCESFNVRRSSAQEHGIPARPVFRSPYHCDDCGDNFLVISRRTYIRLGIALALTLVIAVLALLTVNR